MSKMQLACFSLLSLSVSVLLLVLPFLFGGGVLCDEVRIVSEDEFIEFSNSVNNGKNYIGTTVYLESDLDFAGGLSQQIQPIGTESNSFLGTFDGQGHTISNFVVNSSSEYVGLFAYSDGMSVRNVVIDSTCSITSSRVSSSYFDTCIGGIVGHCQPRDPQLIIENTVNMARVSFNGSTSSGYLHIGGIAGYIYSLREFDFVVRNCANYGSFTLSGVYSNVCVGGILGFFGSYAYGTCRIQNSFNYGEISTENNDKITYKIGGIAGQVDYTVIENCLNAGRISSNKTSDIGSIIGYVVNGHVNILNCFWSSDINFSASGSTYPKIDNETSQVELNMSTVGKLNEYASNNSWNKWILNTNNASVSFKINDYKGFTVKPQIILLPDLADNERRRFTEWFNDEELTSPFISNEVTSDTTLYGKFCVPDVIITLDVNGGDKLAEKEMIIGCDGIYGTLPAPTRTEHKFSGWFTEIDGGELVESNFTTTILKNHTLYAHWIPNNYTITFDFNNGTEINDIFPFNASIDYPADMKKEGYTFSGWSPNPERVPAESITVVAQWEINQYSVTFDFNNGTKINSVLPFNSSINYPSVPSREGFTFNGWSPNLERVPAENITIVAQWKINQYSITFDFNNGTKINSVLPFNSSINYPNIPTREGYTFNGWSPNPERMPAENITVVAQWTVIISSESGIPSESMMSSESEKISDYVEIIFGMKNMSKEEAMEVIERYAYGAEFTIERFENDESGEIKVVIKFADKDAASEFVRNVNQNKRPSDNFIKIVRSIADYKGSFSPSFEAFSSVCFFF